MSTVTEMASKTNLSLSANRQSKGIPEDNFTSQGFLLQFIGGFLKWHSIVLLGVFTVQTVIPVRSLKSEVNSEYGPNTLFPVLFFLLLFLKYFCFAMYNTFNASPLVEVHPHQHAFHMEDKHLLCHAAALTDY